MADTQTLTAPQTFEQKLMARIRESIGELMSEEDLKKILDRGVEEALFSRKPELDQYQRVIRTNPSFVENAVKELLAEKMKDAVDKWCITNSQILTEAIEQAVKVGIGKCMLDALDYKMQGLLMNLRGEIEERLR